MTANQIPHPNQVSVAVESGVDMPGNNTVQEVVAAIESKLGGSAEEEAARWFVLSVLQHLRKARWSEPASSGLELSEQTRLAKDCLAVEGFAVSLRTVTKDPRSRYRMLGFASTKKLERAVLATGTKAYKIAANVVVQAGLYPPQATAVSGVAASKKQAVHKRTSAAAAVKTIVGRRAKRRGFSEDEFLDTLVAAGGTSRKRQATTMSEEEFSDLDAALSSNNSEIPQKNWGDQRNEDRWSRILGLLAGIGFFAFVALIFL